MANPGGDAVDLLMREHRLVEQLFLQLDAAVAAGDEADQRELADRLIEELTAHAAIEEEVLYPAARQVPEAAAMVDESVAEHAELKGLLARLDGKDPGDDDFVEGFGRARDLFTSHVGEEEGDLFPKLRDFFDEHKLVTLRNNLAMARKTAPTSPASATPVAAVADAASSLLDKAKDAIRHIKD